MKHRNVSRLRQIGFVLEAAVVIPLGNLASLLSWQAGRSLASMIGAFSFRLCRNMREQASKNLDIIYGKGSLTRKEKDRIIKRLFVNIASSFFEYIKLEEVTRENYSQFVNFENSEAFDRAVEEGKGVLAVSAHLGNWEFLGSVGAKLGKDIAAVIHRQLNPYTDKWLREIREKKGGVRCFYDEVSHMRQVVGHLRAGGILALLADEIYPVSPVFVPFFGRRAATPDGPAKLHFLYGSPIVICFALKQAGGKYLLTFDGPYHFEKTGHMRRDCEVVMTWINTRYERVIRKHPDQWFSLLTPRWERNRPEDFRNRLWR